MESEVYLALHVFLSALSKPLLIRKSVNVKQIAHHTKSLACRVCVLICGGDYSSGNQIHRAGGCGGTVTVLCSCNHPSTNRRPRAYTVAYRLLLLVSDALNFY